MKGEGRGAELGVTPAGLGAVALGLAALWLLSGLVLPPRLLTTFRGQLALRPLYAFWMPRLAPQAAGFLVAGTLLVLLAGLLCDPRRTPRGWFAASLLGASVLLPLALFVVRGEPGGPGEQFNVYRNEEFYHDALRIRAFFPFLAHYVELMPRLSLHGRHFPPGHAVTLWAVAQAFGPGTLPAGITVLVFFAGAILLAWVGLERIASPAGARQGALLLLACPSLLDFACTSMDAVFLFFATLAWWLALRAFSPEGTPWGALAAGADLLLATLFSFSTLLLGLAIGLYGAASGWRTPRLTATRLGSVGLGYAIAAVAVRAAFGFSILACFLAAGMSARRFTIRWVIAVPGATWSRVAYANTAAFVIGSGVALVTAAAARLWSRPLAADAWTPAALVTLALMAVGGIYFLETERVWMFAMPWLAGVAVSAGSFSPRSLRLLLGAGLLQALLMEILLYTLW